MPPSKPRWVVLLQRECQILAAPIVELKRNRREGLGAPAYVGRMLATPQLWRRGARLSRRFVPDRMTADCVRGWP